MSGPLEPQNRGCTLRLLCIQLSVMIEMHVSICCTRWASEACHFSSTNCPNSFGYAAVARSLGPPDLNHIYSRSLVVSLGLCCIQLSFRHFGDHLPIFRCHLFPDNHLRLCAGPQGNPGIISEALLQCPDPHPELMLFFG